MIYLFLYSTFFGSKSITKIWKQTKFNNQQNTESIKFKYFLFKQTSFGNKKLSVRLLGFSRNKQLQTVLEHEHVKILEITKLYFNFRIYSRETNNYKLKKKTLKILKTFVNFLGYFLAKQTVKQTKHSAFNWKP